jgi:hypothetical protein
MKPKRVLLQLIIIANILLFPYSTPTDALEIVILSGRRIV